MVPTWIASNGTLRSTASATGFIGAVVVNIGGTTWDFYTGASQSTYPGHQIGVIIGPSSVIVQGNPVAVQTCGIIPPDYFNIGAGNAGTVIATGGSVLGRGSAGQVIGTADSSGNVTIYPSYVASGGGLAGPVIGEVAGYALATNTMGNGQAWVYNGSVLMPQSVITSGNSAFNSYGADLTGNSTQQFVQAISGNAGGGGVVPLNNVQLQFSATTNAPSITQATSVTGAGVNMLLQAQSAKVASGAPGGSLQLSGGAPDGVSQPGIVEVLVPTVATPLVSWGSTAAANVPVANHQIGTTDGANTGQLGISRYTMLYTQLTTVVTSQGIVTVSLPANASHAIKMEYVVRQHGAVGVMAAGEIAASMYSGSATVTLVGVSHAIWTDDPSSIFASNPTIIGTLYGQPNLRAAMMVTTITTQTYDVQVISSVVSN